MKCSNCQKEIPIICSVETLKCEFYFCQEKVNIPNPYDEEINYLVICPQHHNQLSLVRQKLFQLEELIEARLGIEEAD